MSATLTTQLGSIRTHDGYRATEDQTNGWETFRPDGTFLGWADNAMEATDWIRQDRNEREADRIRDMIQDTLIDMGGDVTKLRRIAQLIGAM